MALTAPVNDQFFVTSAGIDLPTASYSVSGTGTRRVWAYVQIEHYSGSNPTAVSLSFGGVAMTLVAEQFAGGRNYGGLFYRDVAAGTSGVFNASSNGGGAHRIIIAWETEVCTIVTTGSDTTHSGSQVLAAGELLLVCPGSGDTNSYGLTAGSSALIEMRDQQSGAGGTDGAAYYLLSESGETATWSFTGTHSFRPNQVWAVAEDSGGTAPDPSYNEGTDTDIPGNWSYSTNATVAIGGFTFIATSEPSGDTVVRRLDAIDDASPERVVSHSFGSPGDDHNNGGLLVLPDGRLLHVYSGHSAISGTDVWYRICDDPTGTFTWSAEKTIPNSADCAYARAVRTDTDVIFFWRQGGSPENDGRMAIARCAISGIDTASNFSAKRLVSDFEASPYFNLISDGPDFTISDNRFYLICGAGYAVGAVIGVYDSDNDRFEDLEGNILTEPFLWSDLTAITNGGFNRLSVTSPTDMWAIIREDGGSTYGYRVWRWDGTTWTADASQFVSGIPEGIGTQSGHAGGFAVDPFDERILYLSRQAAANGAWEIELWHDPNGTQEWSYLHSITDDSNPTTQDNIRPAAVRGSAQGGVNVVWLRGQHTDFDDYNTEYQAISSYDPADYGGTAVITGTNSTIAVSASPGTVQNIANIPGITSVITVNAVPGAVSTTGANIDGGTSIIALTANPGVVSAVTDIPGSNSNIAVSSVSGTVATIGQANIDGTNSVVAINASSGAVSVVANTIGTNSSIAVSSVSGTVTAGPVYQIDGTSSVVTVTVQSGVISTISSVDGTNSIIAMSATSGDVTLPGAVGTVSDWRTTAAYPREDRTVVITAGRTEMSKVTWPFKRAGEVLNYALDWASVLASGETISNSTFDSETGVVIDAQSNDDTKSTVKLSGGQSNEGAELTCTVTTSAGNKFIQPIELPIY